MQKIAPLALLLAGAIHLIPLLGVFGAAPLASLYGTTPSEPNTLILLRHRAVLFGIVGGVCMAAAFKPRYQWLGLTVGAVSVLSFLLLAWSTGGFNTHLQHVVVADGLALACLVAGALARARSERAPARI
ncbi:peptidoglycan/LPS O-acetylase OafA/YrhL [Acidovorax delafieldii]|uniref:Peptidoglycan/LPS O-acetylase OafA/YrhL n=1 Tax=Acidovorax delafieldii TaxID=47920 RepID=A0AAJ2F1B5_ACIDE|nr:phosphopantetheine adenylyltransferase [Acidovorax delafieldii]MDR6767102.1 peptidoglycan/LPS O-acetylase OafA/YrhL [Acidovorax delafieldii]MDR6838182.1 peptidoglycan/LPS O-acetylase OafA/YrhL [Acidovorax delafieldii]MDR7367814.1 peptidoglycan/LPS O-acetylase OafA/YrhL [Acidovorax delafieldii]